jgi:hypothetical protein
MPLWLDLLMMPMAAPESGSLRRMRRTWQLLCVTTAVFVGFFAELRQICGRLAIPLAAGLLVAAVLYTGLYIARKRRADDQFLNELGEAK